MIASAAISERARRACLVLAFVCASVASTQPAPEAAVKAGFLYNFAKFTEWPIKRLPPAANLVFCVTDTSVAEALQAAVSGRLIETHRLVVNRVNPDDLMIDCAVVYAGNIDARRATHLVNTLRGSHVLSVSDYEGFTDIGGIVRLFRDNGQLRFAVNVDAAGRAQLTLGSQLLGLAVLARDKQP